MQLEREGNTVTVYLEGELDHCAAQQMKRILDSAMQDRDVKHMRLDMKNMSFMDSSGIGVILGRYKVLLQRGGSLSVRYMNRQVEKVFRLSGMDQIIRVE